MIDRAHKLPIKRQAEVLSISRGAAIMSRAQLRKETSC